MTVLKNWSFLFVLGFVSCKEGNDKTILPAENDTTAIIQFAIKQAFFQNDLPAIHQLSRKHYFKDSILFTTDSIPLKLLPHDLDTMKFKILSSDSICNLINSDSSYEEVPNYLYVANFKKTDSIYFILIASKSCLPFGSGGDCGIELVKRKDSFFILHKGYSNYN